MDHGKKTYFTYRYSAATCKNKTKTKQLSPKINSALVSQQHADLEESLLLITEEIKQGGEHIRLRLRGLE